MSQQSAKQFIEKSQKDPNFKKQLSQIKDPKQMEKFLKENGFSFTNVEYKAAAKVVFGHECTEEELMQIAGGCAITGVLLH